MRGYGRCRSPIATPLIRAVSFLDRNEISGRGEKPANFYMISTTILQPESLHRSLGQAFQRSLEQALTHGHGVIVDLLWVGTVDSDGINLLAQSMIQSQDSNNDIKFVGLDCNTRLELERRIQLLLTSSGSTPALGHGVFSPEFEAFLDRHRDSKASEALI